MKIRRKKSKSAVLIQREDLFENEGATERGSGS